MHVNLFIYFLHLNRDTLIKYVCESETVFSFHSLNVCVCVCVCTLFLSYSRQITRKKVRTKENMANVTWFHDIQPKDDFFCNKVSYLVSFVLVFLRHKSVKLAIAILF